MSRPEEAAELLKSGYSLKEIASEMGISISSVVKYLYAQAGEGSIKRSDIVFAIEPDKRELIEASVREQSSYDYYDIYRAAKEKKRSLDFAEVEAYLTLRDARISRGDMYEYLSEIETTLHKFIKSVLMSEYGPEESEWWREGISPTIRKECQSLREEDPEPVGEPYNYTTLIHLREILDKQWSLFSKFLPKEFTKDKKKFLSNLTKLNRVRNGVMHPVRDLPLTEGDFEFVRDLQKSFVYANVLKVIREVVKNSKK